MTGRAKFLAGGIAVLLLVAIPGAVVSAIQQADADPIPPMALDSTHAVSAEGLARSDQRPIKIDKPGIANG